MRSVNRILSDLPAKEWELIEPKLIRKPLTHCQMLLIQTEPIEHILFIEQGVISLSIRICEQPIQVGVVGPEGFIGGSALLMEGSRAISQSVVQVSGFGQQLSAHCARTLMKSCPSFRHRCYRYHDSLCAQVMQLSACNARHALPSRLARWLLMTRDRVNSQNLGITHETLAIMLATRRASIGTALGDLQDRQIIQQERRRVILLKPEELEDRACSCYDLMKRIDKMITSDHDGYRP